MAGKDLSALAQEFGTPLYIYDRATMDASAAAYRLALSAYHPALSSITYAGKAFLCRAIAAWAEAQEFWLDCTGETEIQTAVRAGVSRERILVHGVNKSPADLDAAIKHAGVIVVDNLGELGRIASLYAGSRWPDLWLRLMPGLAVQTQTPPNAAAAASPAGTSHPSSTNWPESGAAREPTSHSASVGSRTPAHRA